MKEEIVLIGGGGHCRSCIDVIETEGRFKIAGVVDTIGKLGQKIFDYEIIATDKDLPELALGSQNFFITIGQIKSPAARLEKYLCLKTLSCVLPVIISPLAYVSRYAFVGEGTIIMHKAFVNAGADIGRNCIINTGAIIEHDAVIGDNCHISTGAVVNGGAVIREKTFVGSNSMIREYIEIGSNCIVGGGLSVMRNLPADSTLKRNN